MTRSVEHDLDPPSAVFWYCRNGSILVWTLDHVDEPCEDCDCGADAYLKEAEGYVDE